MLSWRYRTVSARLACVPATMQAWLSLSEKIEVALRRDALDDALVRHVARREEDAGVLPHELGEALLQLQVEVERAVEEAAARAARAVVGDRLLRGLDDARVVRQAEVVVRPGHDDLVPADDGPRALRHFDGAEVGVEVGGFDLGVVVVRIEEPTGLVEDGAAIALGRPVRGRGFLYVRAPHVGIPP